MYLRFAWRYFRSPKSTHAIQVISRITALVIAFATCCQLLVLSVYNGFEDLVKSMYSSFYAEIKIVPREGKYLEMEESLFLKLQKNEWIKHASSVLEEKALLQNGEFQSVIQLKGVDEQNALVTGVSENMRDGRYDLGDADSPMLVVGNGVKQSTGILLDPAFGPDQLTVFVSKPGIQSNNPLASLSQGTVVAGGSFSIQQEFDNSYALTNLDFIRQLTGIASNRFTSIEIKLKQPDKEKEAIQSIEALIGNKYVIQNRYQQNVSLYKTLRTEKWVIYAVLTMILMVAAFNLISALTMLILEKKPDIGILMSMGTTESQIQRIFLTEGMLLGCIGTGVGMSVAWLLGMGQQHFHWIPIQGNSFLIDYFPVKFIWTDALLVAITSGCIIGLAAWLPARAAARSRVLLTINNQ
jgi:lipoprotein-releasing system permease protein